MAELQARLQTLTEEYTKLQSGKLLLAILGMVLLMLIDLCIEMSKSVQARQKLEAQKQENVGVEEVRQLRHIS